MVVEIFEDLFGSTVDPLDQKTKDVRRFTFSNSDTKTSVQVITWGATITTLKVVDNKGDFADIVCGFDDINGYQLESNPYFGATIGRICNRVANGKFKLDGQEVNVTKNWNNRHQLHGGLIGFDKVVWDIEKVDKKAGSVTLTHTNPDGHEGYPGELKATVVFKMNKIGSFQVNFFATTNKTTAVNLTNHSYFNLAGHDAGSSKLYEHLVKINADKITITDEDSIPTGGFMNVENTPFDLRQIDNLGVRLRILDTLGFDDNFCVNNETTKTVKVAKAYHRPSGRWMEVSSDQPGVQFYTSNFMPDPAKNESPIIGKGGAKYWKHGAFCFETQKYPDSVNHPDFPTTSLKPGETYSHEVVFTFGVCED